MALHLAPGTALGKGRDNLYKGETFGLFCENQTWRQPGGKKGGGLSPRESEVGAEAPGNVPDGLISPPPVTYRRLPGSLPESNLQAGF